MFGNFRFVLGKLFTIFQHFHERYGWNKVTIPVQFVLFLLISSFRNHPKPSLPNSETFEESCLSKNFYKVENIPSFLPFFLRTHTPVQNPSLVEHKSSYSGETKLQYDFKNLNATELVTQMQSISQVKILTSNIIDLRGGGPFWNQCGSVCNKRWTVNLVTARGTGRAGATPRIHFFIFSEFLRNFKKSHHFSTFW